MKGLPSLVALAAVVSLVLNACQPAPEPAPTVAPPTATAIPQTFVVSTTDDSGAGSLRRALQDAQPGDTITFNPEAFPPDAPASIRLVSPLPPIEQGRLTIDAENAGVTLDGSHAAGDWIAAVEVSSGYNVIRGLHILHFTGVGIKLNETARFNKIDNNQIGDVSDGIGIWGSDNTVAGNFIGTDAVGHEIIGASGPGIFLDGTASQNTIGPRNVIAYNGTVGGGGVEIRSSSAFTNTITANSIHDNSFAGIYYNINDATLPTLPTGAFILDFDLAAGTAAGITCPGCVVELFSTHSKDGEAYEGSATADESGAFNVSTGKPFTGPALTATATGTDGSTSQFAAPTAGAKQSASLQAGGTSPRNLIAPASGTGRQPSLIGDTFSGVTPDSIGDPAELARHSTWLGHTWIRVTFGPGEWSQHEATGLWSPLSFGEYEDQTIDNLNQAGVAVLYDLLYFDKDLKTSPGALRFRNEQEIQAYLDYARLVVTHFKGRIQYYETWNEPDLRDYGQQGIAVQDYIDVIRRVVPVIRAADPQAKVVIGASSDLRYPEVQAYVMSIVNSDVMPLVDGVSIHPMYSTSPNYGELRAYYYNYPALIKRIRDAATAHGFAGQLLAEEIAWKTPANALPTEAWHYTAMVAAKYYARGIVTNRGLGLMTGIGGEGYDQYAEIVRVVQNLNVLLAGAQSVDSPQMQLDSTANEVVKYAFLLPNGDRLLALWTDGAAADDDPSVPATLSFPGLSADKVTGYDILHGFGQQLVAQNDGGSLVIPGLLLKDYPVFIRLAP